VRRGWFVAAIVIAVLAIAIAALAMRLSDDDGDGSPSASEWASSVCTSLSTWKSSIAALADVGSGTLNAQTLDDRIASGKQATQTMVGELQTLGAPDLESGEQAKQQLSSSANELQTSFAQLQQSAEEATSSGSLSVAKLAELAPQFQKLLDQASSTLDELENADVAAASKQELQAAFTDAPACKDLRSDDG
jgi:ElaB/YqjD/DUF883 family membrane-anchored ribosome-binding protein